MKAKSAYQASLVFTILGLMLSGYLSFYSLFRSSCHAGFLPFLTCGTNPVKFWGVPQCVVGFAMYFILAIVILMGMMKLSKKSVMTTVMTVGIAGVLFSGTLAVYELWFQLPHPTTLPACVYGFFLYLGIMIVSALSLKSYGQTTAPAAPTPPMAQ